MVLNKALTSAVQRRYAATERERETRPTEIPPWLSM